MCSLSCNFFGSILQDRRICECDHKPFLYCESLGAIENTICDKKEYIEDTRELREIMRTGNRNDAERLEFESVVFLRVQRYGLFFFSNPTTTAQICMPFLTTLQLHGSNYGTSWSNENDADFILRDDMFESCPNLESVSMTLCEIREISGSAFRSCRRLKHLNISRNYIEALPESLDASFYESLESFDCSCNNIKSISPGYFKKFGALRRLNISNNSFEFLEGIFNDKNFNFFDSPALPLEYFVCTDTNIVYVNIYGVKFPNLKYINLSQNHRLDEIVALRGCTALETFICSSTDIVGFRDRTFEDCAKSLRHLDVSNNSMYHLNRSIRVLQSLEYLDVSKTMLSQLEPEFLHNNRKTLRVLRLNGDAFCALDFSILECTKLKRISMEIKLWQRYQGDFERPEDGMPLQVVRFIEGVNGESLDTANKKMRKQAFRRMVDQNESIYTNTQSVHDQSIVGSVKSSVYKLTTQKKFLKTKAKHEYLRCREAMTRKILDDPYFDAKTKDVLVENIGDESVHSAFMLTFFDLLSAVFFTIDFVLLEDEAVKCDEKKRRALEKEIKGAIANEMTADNLACICFTGKMSRLVNALNGFTPLVNIQIHSSEQITAVYQITKKKAKSTQHHKELFMAELRDRDFPSAVIEEWSFYFDE